MISRVNNVVMQPVFMFPVRMVLQEKGMFVSEVIMRGVILKDLLKIGGNTIHKQIPGSKLAYMGIREKALA